jgi:hypothetical protein
MKNIIFERRYREMPLNRGSVPQQRLALERLPEFAAELVRLNVVGLAGNRGAKDSEYRPFPSLRWPKILHLQQFFPAAPARHPAY